MPVKRCLQQIPAHTQQASICFNLNYCDNKVSLLSHLDVIRHVAFTVVIEMSTSFHGQFMPSPLAKLLSFIILVVH